MSGSNLHCAADHRRRPAVCRIATLALLLVAALPPSRSAAAQQSYMLDQRFGTIRFSVGHLGLFSSQGRFDRFQARLLLDQKHPERTRITVDVAAGSEMMGWQQATDMLRSKDFLDVRQYPVVRFTSTSVVSVAPDRYRIQGMLRLRGVTRPVALSARLVGRHVDPVRHDEQADFVVTGSLLRSAFGMTTDQVFIANRVRLTITARLELATNAG